jgi:hypothetical protein
MIKVIGIFLILFGIFFIGIQAVRSLSGTEVLALTKLIGYSIICVVLTMIALTGFVLIF